jgi:hypothetical protein
MGDTSIDENMMLLSTVQAAGSWAMQCDHDQSIQTLLYRLFMKVSVELRLAK